MDLVSGFPYMDLELHCGVTMADRANRVAIFAALLTACALSQTTPASAQPNNVQTIVDQAICPIMKQYGIPGMAVGLTVRGRHYLFEYGVASKATGKRVDEGTLFEIGPITKTFTATLVSYTQLTHTVSLSDEASANFPSLLGTSFDRIRLVNLGTHTAGGLPLQFPNAVKTTR